MSLKMICVLFYSNLRIVNDIMALWFKTRCQEQGEERAELQ